MPPAARSRTPQHRGAYAKGVAKREEILTRALDVIAREGYRGASVKELARAAGLSQAGLLHYFGSKEELFIAILRKRDQADAAQFHGDGDTVLDDLHTGYLRVIRHNGDVPGLVQLFSQLAVDAADRDHPAHAFFTQRGQALRDRFATAIADAQSRGELSAAIAPDTLARILQAVSDGLQLQWLLEPDIAMADVVDALVVALRTRRPEETA